MARPIKATDKNTNVLQSYILTTARYQFSVYEKRILYRLVEFAQGDIKSGLNGEPIKNNLRPLYAQLRTDGDKEFGMYISDILDIDSNEGSTRNHYERVKDAFRSLMKKQIEWEDPEKQTWICTPFVFNASINKGYAEFCVSKWFWAAIMNFAKGFRKYELLTAMKLKSPYSMRLYEMMSGQKKPFTLTIEQVREMFGLGDKYVRPSSIKERIFEPAKAELDAVAPYSFNIKEERSGKGKTSPIIAFTFVPVFHENNQDKEIQAKERQSKTTSRLLYRDSDIWNILKHDYNFKSWEQNRNKETITQGEKIIPDFVGFLRSIKNESGYTNATNKIGYVIGAIKGKIKDIQQEQQPKPGEPIMVTPPSKNKYKNKW